MYDLVCDCGREPTIYVQCPTATSPGYICQVRCECGCSGSECWDVRIPWPDIFSDWNDETQRYMRQGVRNGLLRRDGRKYVLTDVGAAVVESQFAGKH